MRRLTDDLPARVARRLDARLDAGPGAPLAVALSGGGDSLALAWMAADWARARRRPLHVLTVDHGLNAQSPAWTRACAATARRMGGAFHPLSWRGPHPASGLPAAARRARHALLADAARKSGARVILMGHTADDLAEAELMRADGGTTPSPREWSPSPAWPEGRGVFLMRPLLSVRRAELRDWLAARNETWIEDPANADVRFARSRARLRLTAGGTPPPTPAPDRDAADPAAGMVETLAGLALDRRAFRELDAGTARRIAGIACLAAAGGVRPPRGPSLEALRLRLAGNEEVLASLGGAQVLATGERILWGRSAGEMGRAGVADLVLAPGRSGVFDGRFEIEATQEATVTRLAGRLARLPPADRARLAEVPPGLRGALPAVVTAEGVRLAGEGGSGVRVTPLRLWRFRAACGRLETEAGLTG